MSLFSPCLLLTLLHTLFAVSQFHTEASLLLRSLDRRRAHPANSQLGRRRPRGLLSWAGICLPGKQSRGESSRRRRRRRRHCLSPRKGENILDCTRECGVPRVKFSATMRRRSNEKRNNNNSDDTREMRFLRLFSPSVSLFLLHHTSTWEEIGGGTIFMAHFHPTRERIEGETGMKASCSPLHLLDTRQGFPTFYFVERTVVLYLWLRTAIKIARAFHGLRFV